MEADSKDLEVSGQEIFDSIESNTKLRRHREEFAKAQTAFEREKNDEAVQRMRYEVLAFSLRTRSTGGYFGGTRFTAVARLKDEKGEERVIPDPSEFTEEAFAYYKHRAEFSQSPIQRARYADLLWEARRSYQHARIAVLSYLECIDVYLDNEEADTTWGLYLVDALKRARDIAIQINDSGLKEETVRKAYATIARLEAGRRYRWTLDVIRLLAEIRQKHSVALEPLIVCATAARDSFAATSPYWEQHFSELLHELHKAAGNETDAVSAKLAIIDSLIREADVALEASDGGLLAVDRLNRAVQLAVSIGAPRPLQDDLTIRLKDATGRARAQMKEVTIPLPVSFDRYEAAAEVLRGMTVGEGLAALARARWLPSQSAARRLAQENAREFVFAFLMPRTLIRNDNPVLTVASDEEKLELEAIQHVQRSYTLYASVQFPPMLNVLRDNGLTADAVIKHLQLSPVFNEARLKLLRAGFDRYLAGDGISAVHVLAVQVEGVIRELAALLGRPSSVRARSGIQEKQLESLLEDQEVARVLGEDFVFFLRVFLIDQRGDNLRHDVAHGLLQAEACDERIGALLFLLFLRLSVLEGS